MHVGGMEDDCSQFPFKLHARPPGDGQQLCERGNQLQSVPDGDWESTL